MSDGSSLIVDRIAVASGKIGEIAKGRRFRFEIIKKHAEEAPEGSPPYFTHIANVRLIFPIRLDLIQRDAEFLIDILHVIHAGHENPSRGGELVGIPGADDCAVIAA